MSEDIVDLFDSLPAENAPRHLPVGGTMYRLSWVDDSHRDDWKADGYRWRNQSAAKELKAYAVAGIKKIPVADFPHSAF